jgi:hypothetical protein
MMLERTSSDDNHLAWQGLEIPMRDDWRPLRIEGEHRKGSITIGDMDGPVFQLRWIRPPRDSDSSGWIKARRLSVAGGQESRGAPRPESFESSSWIKNLAIREESKKTVWWGRSERSNVLVEILLTSLSGSGVNQCFLKSALPNLRVASPTEDNLWQIYSARFVIPAGYRLVRKRLAAGDIALEFVRGWGEKLLVRQVYPAGLALERRSLQGWLRDRVFKEHRRFRQETEDRHDGQHVKWSGWKRLPFPLGWISPRRCDVLIRQEQDLDRLMIVKYEWQDGTEVKSVDKIADGMHWSPS